MIQKALEYIVGLKKPFLESMHGNVYSDKPLALVPPPQAGAKNVTTLSALIEYLKANRDDLDISKLTVHVVSPKEVHLISGLLSDRRRETYIIANADLPVFKFGSFYDSESFNIALQAMFTNDYDKSNVVKMAGTITEEAVKTSTDDGVTQTAVVRTGVKVLDMVSVPNPVRLCPYRTFIEVNQPASNFVFRVREGGNMALFEADGGAWRNEAMQNIMFYLKLAFKDLDIDISILA